MNLASCQNLNISTDSADEPEILFKNVAQKGEKVMTDQLKQNLRDKKPWLRGLYMLLFSVIYWVAEMVIVAVVLFQFVHVLFNGKSNERLLKLGQSLSTYVYQIMLFLTFNSEAHPYPLGAWPKGNPPAKARIVKTGNEK